MAHYQILKEEHYHRIGDALAPKTIWNELFTNKNQSIGLETLVIRVDPFKRGDTPKESDLKRITLQVSNKIKQGIFFSLNDHHNIDSNQNNTPTSAADQIVLLLGQKWENTLHESTNIFDTVINRVLEQ